MPKMRWLCRCECGNETFVRTARLLIGETKSCGCLAAELSSKRKKTHGGSDTELYKYWARMRQRVFDKNLKSYPRYGGRGISICKRWLGIDGFLNFRNDMGDPPSKRHALDRIDNNGPYSPKNCRWATYREQNRNSGNNRIIEMNGESRPLVFWCEKYDIAFCTAWARLKRGWSAERTFNTPVR